MTNLRILVTIIVQSIAGNQEECNYPLGVEDGRIPDANFKASRSHAEISAPFYARLNSKAGAGAWCHPTVTADDKNEYLQIELLDLAIVSQIAIQGRFNGDERAERLRVNISIDGEHWVEHPKLFKINSNDSALNLSPVMTGKFIRLIPRTEQGMPICIRTELYGCYRTDKLSKYRLSHLPMRDTPEVGLDDSMTGIGRLNDGQLDEYLKFKSSTGEMEIELFWQEAVNITELLFHTSARSNSCFSRVTVLTELDEWTYNLGCSRGTIGPRIIPLLIAKIVDRVTLKLEFSGILELAELTWSTEISELKPILMSTIVTEVDEVDSTDFDLPSWVTPAGCIIGGLLFLIILVIFVCVTRKRFRRDKRSVMSYNSSSTLRDGTWFNLIPNARDGQFNHAQSNIVHSNHQLLDQGLLPHRQPFLDNRTNDLYVKNHFANLTPSPLSPAHHASNSFASFYPPQQATRPVLGKMEFGHEYSEIGSITADSGRGESVEGEKTDYAELSYA